MQARGLSADGRELYLELVQHTKRLVKLGVYVWHMGVEGVFVGAAVVTLDTVKGLFERTLNRAAVTQVFCELLLGCIKVKGVSRVAYAGGTMETEQGIPQ